MVDDRASTAGAESGIAMVFAREYTRLVRAAVLLVGDLETAEDVVQDAFVAVHRHWGSMADPERVGGYLHRAVINRSRSVLRHRTVVRRHADRRTDEPPMGDTADVVADRATREAVIAALASLPRRQREVLVLRHYLDLSEAEIAHALRISPGSVKTHASRGAATLRTRLRIGETDE